MPGQIDHGEHSKAAAGHVLSDDEHRAVVDAIRQWRAFGMEMADLFEQQGGRTDPAHQGALRMVALADQVLGILGRSGEA